MDMVSRLQNDCSVSGGPSSIGADSICHYLSFLLRQETHPLQKDCFLLGRKSCVLCLSPTLAAQHCDFPVLSRTHSGT